CASMITAATKEYYGLDSW
nr:immunoglobulin heavy chain junction region [Macaca mulatta]MOX38368.1 immunoglobulin heavy chain junction region [Macaca mulatta]MOX39250.1 immunoglobulin heavy chain junction region [Macaca mulatta]MOX39332.1 immunoglobulin heavy chain junction region [Macaca mulatta]MOX39550.1 immunoglobulin heavy chain junction region [Macaca mulatta]